MNNEISKAESRRISKENEAKFQDAYNRWIASGKTDKQAYDEMWFCIDLCCSNICKKIASGHNIGEEEFHNRYMDSVCYVMEFIKNRGVHPSKLSSYCYLRCIKFMQSPQAKFYDLLQELPEYETKDWSNINGEDDE